MYKVINKGGYPAGTDVINPDAIFKTEDQAKNYVEHLVQLGYDENDFTITQENKYNEDELRHIAVNYAIHSLKGYQGTFTNWFNKTSKDWRTIANSKP